MQHFLSVLSQLKIHRLKHTRKQSYECTECSEPFKYRHDMLKHLREHTAPLLRCKHCEYRGMKLKLTAHIKQHNPSTYKRCTVCKELFGIACHIGITNNSAN